MKKKLLSLVASIAIFSSNAIASEKVYATVNGEKITSTDVAIALRDPRIQLESLPKLQQKKVLDSIIEQTLLAQYALTTDVVNTQEFKYQLEKLKANLAFQLWMKDFGKNIQVSDAQIKEYYDKNKNQFKAPLQLKASHILVKTKKEAEEIISKLEKASDKKAEFTKLAKEYSIGPSGKMGGELGWFTKEKMVPAFSDAASKLKKGEFTTTPVKTQFGYHIIFLDDKKDASSYSFNQVKQAIKQQLLQEQFIKAIKQKAQELKKKAKISIK